MFGFFKKKEKKVVEEKIEEPLTEEEISDLKQTIERITGQIHEVDASDSAQKEALAKLYEAQGLAYSKLNDFDQAVRVLEQSLELKLTIGEGYKTLMSLYNRKRAEAAHQGDDAGIDYYMGKMDEMRQIAKKVTISG